MDLLTAHWIPVRADGGTGKFRLLSYEELLCSEDKEAELRISLPRDDLELACLQLLICLTQVIFLPVDEKEWRWRRMEPMTQEFFADKIAPFRDRDWFKLDHPTKPFMQTRGLKVAEATPLQKLFIGLPEGNNHAFFNEVGEVRRISPGSAAIALFNQASNCPSFGGGFKGSLRGGAPITTLVMGETLRETVWRNVVSLPLIKERLPDYEPDFTRDRPTWVHPITRGELIYSTQISLLRGLFWQPAHVELIPTTDHGTCDITGQNFDHGYEGFFSERFSYNLQGVWPHPHGVRIAIKKKGKLEFKFTSFTTIAPAWTQLSEFVIPGMDLDSGEGTTPAASVLQAGKTEPGQGLNLIVGGYRNKQAAILERRHELMSLAQGWADNPQYLQRLIKLGKDAKKTLCGKLYYASQGDKSKGMKGLGIPIHATGEKLFYAKTEGLMHEFLQNSMTFRDYMPARKRLAESLRDICQKIFKDMTDPYSHKPELIPIIAVASRMMDFELHNLVEGDQPNASTPKKQKRATA